MDIDKLIRNLRLRSTTSPSEALPDNLLLGLVEGTLSDEQRANCIKILARRPEDMAILAVLLQGEDDSKAFSPLDPEHAMSLWKTIPICRLSLGVARLGFKLLGNQEPEDSTSQERLSIPNSVSNSLGLPTVLPADRAEFQVSFQDCIVSIVLRTFSGVLEGYVSLQTPKHIEQKTELSIYENETFLSSEILVPGASYPLGAIQEGTPYFLHIRGSVNGEVSLRCKAVPFSTHDCLSLAMNLIANGRFRDATALFVESNSTLDKKNLLRRLRSVIESGTSVFDELVPNYAGATLRSASAANDTESARKILTEDLLGRWASDLPLMTRSLEQCQEILRILKATRKDKPLDARVDFVCKVLEIWSMVDAKERSVEDVLFTMASELKAIVDSYDALSTASGQEGEGVSNGSI